MIQKVTAIIFCPIGSVGLVTAIGTYQGARKTITDSEEGLLISQSKIGVRVLS
jgi:hypothetical protein